MSLSDDNYTPAVQELTVEATPAAELGGHVLKLVFTRDGNTVREHSFRIKVTEGRR